MPHLACVALLLTLACGGAERLPEAQAVDLTAWTDPPGAEPFEEARQGELLQALEAMGEAYVPRTEHLHPDGRPIFVNRLIDESSPYLHQHAHNPVNWHPWGPEAFESARRLDRPILLSIGYSTCHWCHVMERESFEDLEIAAYINAHFIPIKVDREERPDVDGVYMDAVRALTRRGGWPLTAVLTPDLKPFFGGTYFPARTGDRGSRQGFLSILQELHGGWSTDRDRLLERAERLSMAMARHSAPRAAGGTVDGEAALNVAVDNWLQQMDPNFGGLGTGNKFPRPTLGMALLRHHARSGDPKVLDAITITLDSMMQGGLRDHVGGGFHRYTTERTWLVPHFEKMLYDQAQLVVLYLEAFQATGQAEYAEVARETLDYVVREMTHTDGGFYSATDADSKGPSGHDEEGYFFTWTPAELATVLGPERALWFGAFYGVTAAGNFEHRNILFTRGNNPAKVAGDAGMTIDELGVALEQARGELYAARSERIPPGLDDKVLTAWNGLMISAFVRGAVVLNDDAYLARARSAADFLLATFKRPDGRLGRSWRAGTSRADGVLDDYAFTIAALLDLFEATSEVRWLIEAIALQGVLDAHFVDATAGGYFMTPDDGETLLVKQKPDWDGALPSGNSVSSANLLRLAELTGNDAYRESAGDVFASLSESLVRGPTGVPAMLAALDFDRGPAHEIILMVPTDRSDAEPFLKALRDRFVPHKVVVVTTPEEAAGPLGEVVAMVRNRPLKAGRATAYVCEKSVCQLPTSDPAEFARQLTEAP
ncbi:MAG: thioredoxin domain-containing protein [Proteobacteria bacterium]|nr:thioredoxin domain-containing protein [Pseudomonadota bacterium]